MKMAVTEHIECSDLHSQIPGEELQSGTPHLFNCLFATQHDSRFSEPGF